MNIKKYNGSKPMNKKIVESLITEEVEEEAVKGMSLQASASALIKLLWDMVDSINGNLIMAQDFNSDEFKEVLDNILTDCYTNIGQLEKFVKEVDPAADSLDIGNEVEEIPDVEVETDEVELPADDIPSDLLS